MEYQEKQERAEVAEVETPANFLTKLGEALREKDDVDVGLVDILAKHVLTATPKASAVADAKQAIVKLASERAYLPTSEVTGA